MAKIDDYTIRRIKDTAKIYDVVSDFIQLRKSGVRWSGLCPFHADKHTGNFVVYPRGNCYTCFSCGAKGGPVEFVMNYLNLGFADAIRYLGKKYNIDTDMQEINYTPPPPRPQPAPLPMLTIPDWMVRRTQEKLGMDDLVQWIRTINWDAAAQARIDTMLADYRIGHSKLYMTIFWQIDEKGIVHTGKCMRYKQDGHRDRESRHSFDFIHSMLYRDRNFPQYDPDKMEMKQCLFGLHLLNRYAMPKVAQTVNLVESEKTALIMAIAYGNHPGSMWMATGGMENLTKEKLMPLIKAGKTILCWPDKDGIEKWNAKVKQIQYDRISVHTKHLDEWWKPEDGPKADVADIVVRLINGKRIYKTVGEVLEDMPQLREMHEKLNLELVGQ